MKNKPINQIITAGLFIAFGIVIPMMFHAVGLGSTFLPMHIPVLLSGFVLNTSLAAMVGALTPFLSSLLTSMPPAFPVMPYMVFELATYGFMTSLFYNKMQKNVYVSLVGSMIAGRIVAGIAVWGLSSFFAAKLPGPVAFITGSIARSMPGIVIQMLIIPAVVILMEKYAKAQKRGKNYDSERLF